LGGVSNSFRADAEAIAEETRGDMGIRNIDRLDARRLAAKLEIPVLPLAALEIEHGSDELAQALAVLRTDEASTLSALTVFDGARRLIVHNEQHSAPRQASDICHELSHGLLLHEPGVAIDGRGCRSWNSQIEEEANYLAGALLIPGKAARWAAKRGMDIAAAARHFGCSEPMARWRMGVSGAARLMKARTQR
jgi:Zn-dependent peptidase ImmA (M78 family)